MKRLVPKGFDESGPGWIVKLEEPDTTAEDDDAKLHHCLVFLGGGRGSGERRNSFVFFGIKSVLRRSLSACISKVLMTVLMIVVSKEGRK